MSTYALHYYIFCICQIKWADRLVRAVSLIIVLNTTILCNHLPSHWLLKMFPRRPYSIKSAAFLSHLKSLSDVDEGGFWSSTRFYQFCMHIYTSTKTLCWYYMKNMIMMSIISRIFVSFMFFDYSQSSFMEEKCTIKIPFFGKILFNISLQKSFERVQYLLGFSHETGNQTMPFNYGALSLNLFFSRFLMFDVRLGITNRWGFGPSESRIRIRTTVLLANLQHIIISTQHCAG